MTFDRAYDPFRALGEAWALVRRAPLPLLLGGIVLFLLTDGDDGADLWRSWSKDSHVAWDDLPAMFVVGAVGSISLAWDLVLLALACALKVAFPPVVERAARGERAEVAQLLTTHGRFVALVLALLLAMAAVLAASLPFYLVILGLGWVGEAVGEMGVARVAQFLVFLLSIPFVGYVYAGVYLAEQAVAIEGLAPRAALRRSWELARGRRIRLIFYLVVLRVFEILGLLACGVGVFFTGALRNVALQSSYLRLVRDEDEQAAWLVGDSARASSVHG